jgi:hypothetical protein
MRLPLLDFAAAMIARVMATMMVRMMLWQAPLVLIFTLDPGAYVAICWLFGYLLLLVRKWWLNTLLIFFALGALFISQPPPSAEFFVGMLVLILPLSWRPESGQIISPVGLTPTIFLVGSVFIFHIQFFILLLIFIWLLGFLMWFSMVYAGWTLKDLQIKWGRLLAVSIASSSAIVLIFALIPKIDSGAIPSFTRSNDKVKLTDSISAEGFRSLLKDDTVAFRAFPLDDIARKTPYWRVFTLDQQTADGWTRSPRPKSEFAQVKALERPHRSFDILAEDHDLSWIPIPGWPVPGIHAANRVTPFAEVESPRGIQRRVKVAVYDHVAAGSKGIYDPRLWAGTTVLGDEGQIGRWARQERQRFSSDQDFTGFLMEHFRTYYSYSTETNYNQDSSSVALDEFFFGSRTGYCSFFAQSMATALRAVGIPAHVVTGYLGGEWNDFGGYWMIRNNMAHAWVEVYFSETGWQRFDPTAVVSPGPNGEAFASTGVFQLSAQNNSDELGGRIGFFSQTAMWADSFNTNITRSIMQFGGTSRGSFKSRITGIDFKTLLWILGGLMASVVVVSGMTALIYQMGYFGAKPGLRLEQQLMGALGGARLPSDQLRQRGEGLIQYTNRIGHIYGDEIKTNLHDLACRISRIRFSDDGGGRGQINAIKAKITAARKSLKKAIADNRR